MCIIVTLRSPLNIVHAGLDIVRSEIQMSADPNLVGGTLTTSVIYITAETAAMIEQAFAASGTAIEILDDLLIYEHIDSGNYVTTFSSDTNNAVATITDTFDTIIVYYNCYA